MKSRDKCIKHSDKITREEDADCTVTAKECSPVFLFYLAAVFRYIDVCFERARHGQKSCKLDSENQF